MEPRSLEMTICRFLFGTVVCAGMADNLYSPVDQLDKRKVVSVEPWSFRNDLTGLSQGVLVRIEGYDRTVKCYGTLDPKVQPGALVDVTAKRILWTSFSEGYAVTPASETATAENR